MNMNIKSKEGIADFIEANLKELGGDAYGVDYVAEKLWEWHESELKNLRLGVVVEQSEQLVCDECGYGMFYYKPDDIICCHGCNNTKPAN